LLRRAGRPAFDSPKDNHEHYGDDPHDQGECEGPGDAS
jgi:hypothetical protein